MILRIDNVIYYAGGKLKTHPSKSGCETLTGPLLKYFVFQGFYLYLVRMNPYRCCLSFSVCGKLTVPRCCV